ncbi:MAG: rhodanese-like domain-containing protein [Cellulophaga sp.]
MSILTYLFGSKANTNKAITILNSAEFKNKIEHTNVQLIDVRTPNEYKNGHIKNAINIDFFSRDFMSNFDNLNRDEAVYIYCRSGSRSRKSANKLASVGFTKIYDLKGGILGYN